MCLRHAGHLAQRLLAVDLREIARAEVQAEVDVPELGRVLISSPHAANGSGRRRENRHLNFYARRDILAVSVAFSRLSSVDQMVVATPPQFHEPENGLVLPVLTPAKLPAVPENLPLSAIAPNFADPCTASFP